jgi:hypothetical protein
LIAQAEKNGDQNATVNVSVALYLATYFDATKECKAFYDKNKVDPNLRDFCVQDYSNIPFSKKFLPKIRKDKSKYITYMKRAEAGDEGKLQKLLTNKKLFSVPWLICPDILLLERQLKEENIDIKSTVG